MYGTGVSPGEARNETLVATASMEARSTGPAASRNASNGRHGVAAGWRRGQEQQIVPSNVTGRGFPPSLLAKRQAGSDNQACRPEYAALGPSMAATTSMTIRHRCEHRHCSAYAGRGIARCGHTQPAHMHNSCTPRPLSLSLSLVLRRHYLRAWLHVSCEYLPSCK
jgi:hypothetical protein